MPPAAAGEDDFPANGLLVGLLLAQGLYYAVRHLVTAGLLYGAGAAGEETFWKDLPGLVTDQGLQAAALFLGAMLAAAGRQHGLALGAALGALNAGLFATLRGVFHLSADDVNWFAQPLLNLFVGAVGGAVGSRVWQPAPELAPLAGDGRAAHEALTTVLPDRPSVVAAEVVPWGRILAGVFVAVAGTLGAQVIRDVVVVAGGGTGREVRWQFVTWEIALIAQVIAGGIAGVGTRGGAAYGFWVGLPAAVFVVVAQAVGDIRIPVPAVPAWLLGTSVPDGSPAALMILGGQALLMATFGGWLGRLIVPVPTGRRSPANG